MRFNSIPSYRFWLLSLALLTGCLQQFHAQSSKDVPVYREIAMRSICLQHAEGLSSVIVDNGRVEERFLLRLQQGSFSRLKKLLVSDLGIRFLKPYTAEEAAVDGFQPEVVARVNVPKAERVLLCFLPPTEGEAGAYTVRSIAADPDQYPLGQLRVVNMLEIPIRFHAGEHSQVLDPRKGTAFKEIKRLNAYKQYNVLVEVRIGQQWRWVQVSNTRWHYSKRKRDLAIAYLDPVSKLPVVVLLEDIPKQQLLPI